MSKDKLLERITSPHQLRRLSEPQLTDLAVELREKIIEVVSRNGGHLASNLGLTELTLALHYVFDFSHDRLLWDVGHQCYAHKMITGRGEQFHTLRKAGGISGFPAPTESPYDLFATGHAGTAISTAAGLAWADLFNKVDNKAVAVVGDASIVNGLSMEGINNTALLQRQFLIILNDNSMAIDRTHGAMAKALDRIRMTQTYGGIKQSAESMLQRMPMGAEISDAIRNIKAGLKTTIHGGQVFETLGFEYFGPVDGHDIHELIRVLRRLADLNRPALLHVHTQKGRGAEYAVEDPCRFHSPSAYTIENGQAIFAKKTQQSWTQVFGDALADAGRRDERIVAITAAMPDGTGLVKFRQEFPARYIDVGISESHALAMAGGLAKAGMRPVVAIYSTFMQRAFDQVFQEVSLQNLPVVLCLDRAGLVGSDGAVHHGFSDIAFLRLLPNLTLMAPADAAEMKAALACAFASGTPCAIRYPRDEVGADLGPSGSGTLRRDECPPFELGKARTLREGADGTFLCYGATVEQAVEASDELARDGISVGVVNARFAKPLDATAISRLLARGKPVVTVEDHSAIGGFGSAVAELAASRGLNAANLRILGIPDRFIAHAKREQQLAECCLDAAGLSATMRDLVRNPAPNVAKRYL